MNNIIKYSLLLSVLMVLSLTQVNASCPKQITRDEFIGICKNYSIVIDLGSGEKVMLKNDQHVCNKNTAFGAGIFKSKDKVYHLKQQTGSKCTYKVGVGEKVFSVQQTSTKEHQVSGRGSK